VADSIDDIVKARAVTPHQVAAAKPSVTRLEHIAKHLSLRRGTIGVALEASLGRAFGDSTDRFADLIGPAPTAATRVVAHRLAAVDVEGHEDHGKPMREERRNSADRAHATFPVVEREVGFGGGVELENLRDGEALLELGPHIRP